MYLEIGASNNFFSDVFHQSPAGNEDITTNNKLYLESD